jgi:hypothetical protein
MPRVGFEPTIPVFEGAKTVYALDRATTLIGSGSISYVKFGLGNTENLFSHISHKFDIFQCLVVCDNATESNYQAR